MSSRRKRKRCRLLAEATAHAPKTRGGWGQGVPTTLSDLIWLRRAIREAWLVPAHVREAIVNELCGDLLAIPESGPAADFGREALSRLRCIIEMEGVNQSIDHAEYAARRASLAPAVRTQPPALQSAFVASDSPTPR